MTAVSKQNNVKPVDINTLKANAINIQFQGVSSTINDKKSVKTGIDSFTGKPYNFDSIRSADYSDHHDYRTFFTNWLAGNELSRAVDDSELIISKGKQGVSENGQNLDMESLSKVGIKQPQLLFATAPSLLPKDSRVVRVEGSNIETVSNALARYLASNGKRDMGVLATRTSEDGKHSYAQLIQSKSSQEDSEYGKREREYVATESVKNAKLNGMEVKATVFVEPEPEK